MKYILFDQNAIAYIVSKNLFQSVEYTEGRMLVEHVRGMLRADLLGDIYVDYNIDGVIFFGKKCGSNGDKENHVLCYDLTTCNILDEKDNADLLTLLQKSFRTALRIWNRQPFTSSERIYNTKSIVFPFVMPDHRAIVIERSVNIERLKKRNISFPLIAYKYSKDDTNSDEVVDVSVLCKAAEYYISKKSSVVRLFPEKNEYNKNENIFALGQVTGDRMVNNENFSFWGDEQQYLALTESQKYVVDYEDLCNPLRIDGAAGTGKTISLLLRAYKLLLQKKKNNEEFSIIFITHSVSTRKHSEEVFKNYRLADEFLSGKGKQKIVFYTLLNFCKQFAGISDTALLDQDAGDAKTDQLMLIQDVLEKAQKDFIINTYKPLLSDKIKKLFEDISVLNIQNICTLLQHEFSVQIKGRTDCTIEKYKELTSIKNGLYCQNEKDKELIFRLFTEYQHLLTSYNNYDVDDVTLQALALLNAPIWRRNRVDEGYDYIFVDEMHLFNINEQSVFHYLTRDYTKKNIPICFALDYSQAIGDRGNTVNDYIETAFGQLKKKKYSTVFRNSPLIANFCASIAVSGVLMFQNDFANPYNLTQNNFTEQEERKSQIKPKLIMYKNDDCMLQALGCCLDEMVKNLQCKRKDIAIISFENRYTTEEGRKKIETAIGKKVVLLDNENKIEDGSYVLASPYAINGLEYQAVILIGVDEGRVPQTHGTSDISQHFVRYAAYNLLYLTSSRAKYRLLILGSSLNGISSCLEHSIESKYLDVEENK